MAASIRLRLHGVLVLVVICAVARAEIIRVDDDHPGDPAPGNSTVSNSKEDGTFNSPYDSIQEAIDIAADSDVILVEPGLYNGPGHFDISFEGKAVELFCVGLPGDCVIDAGQLGRIFSFTSGEGLSTIVDGFTMRNGKLDNIADSFGAGIACIGSSPTLRNCRIENCLTTAVVTAGGGMWMSSCDAWLENSAFVGNEARGIFSTGGGIAMEQSLPTMVNVTIDGNRAGFLGGGLAIDRRSHATFTSCKVLNNRSQFAGGVLIQGSSQPLFAATQISGNRADSTGGVQCNASSPVFRNCLISGNISLSESRGGFDIFANATPLIIHCTIVDNTFIGLGCFGGAAEITHSIISGNTDDVFGCSLSWSLVGDGDPAVGDGVLGGDPQFVVPGVDYRLSPDSPAVDSGDPDFVSTPGQGDYDGHARIICDGVDMGAFERGIADADCNGTADVADFRLWSTCASGPVQTATGNGCFAFDFNADHFVDLSDFAGYSLDFAP